MNSLNGPEVVCAFPSVPSETEIPAAQSHDRDTLIDLYAATYNDLDWRIQTDLHFSFVTKVMVSLGFPETEIGRWYRQVGIAFDTYCDALASRQHFLDDPDGWRTDRDIPIRSQSFDVADATTTFDMNCGRTYLLSLAAS